MPWDYLLTSAGGAGLVMVLGILFAQRVMERTVDSRFDLKMEHVREEMARRLEFDKSDLSVWADLRKDILAEMWQAHRQVVKAMTAVILESQKPKNPKAKTALKAVVETYRAAIHAEIDLLSPEAVEICQQFLEAAYGLLQTPPAGDDNALKTIRNKFYSHTAAVYGLEKMMPWMAQGPS